MKSPSGVTGFRCSSGSECGPVPNSAMFALRALRQPLLDHLHDHVHYPIDFQVGCVDRDGVTGVRARYTIAKPSLTYQFSGRGRIEVSYSLTSVALADRPAGTAAIPYTMARGRKEGANHDISVSCDYRLSHRMNLVAGYTGRRFAGQDFEHFARTQLRAMF